MTSPIIGIGSTVWVFNPNHREYEYDDKGRAIGGPNYRAHFRPYVINGETARSWLIGDGYGVLKVPKQGGDMRECGGGAYGKTRVYMTAAAVDDECWKRHHAGRVASAVSRCEDADLLRKVADIIGYNPSEVA